MSVQYVNAPETFASFGDYSPISRADTVGLVAVAGQFGSDAAGGLSGSGDAVDQARGAFGNVGAALAEVGLGFADVLKFNTYVVGRETIPAFMAARKEVFAQIYPDGEYPPNTLLVVAGLVDERFVVEIEALAVRR